jgi:hypothetical protein
MKKILFFYPLLFFFCSCDKGYTIRFHNLYTEPMDSVVVGKNKIVFTDIPALSATDYTNIARGQYEAKCVSHSKKRFSVSFFVSGKGSGTKTIQVDASGQTQLINN